MGKFGKTWTSKGRKLKWYYKNDNYRLLWINGFPSGLKSDWDDPPVVQVRKGGRWRPLFER